MKVSMERRVLAEAAGQVAKATSTKRSLAILGHILLTANKDGLRLSATDLEIGIQRLIPADVDEEGEATVPAKTFTDLLNVSGNGETVTMQSLKKGNALKLVFGKMSSKINGLGTGDFPLMEPVDAPGIEFQVEDLRDLIAKTAFAASEDVARPVLEGVIFKFEADQLVMASADGFRMSKVSAPLPNFSNGDSPVESIILPAKALQHLSVLLGGRETVTLRINASKRAEFEADDVKMVITPIVGDFPDFEGIIPKSHKVTATFSTKVGLKAVKSARVFAQDAGNLVRMKLDGKSIELFAQDREIGSNETTIKPDSIEGGEMSIGFNVKMLIDFLSIKNGGDMVVFEIDGPNSPAKFTYQGNDDFLHIIMPMHLGG